MSHEYSFPATRFSVKRNYFIIKIWQNLQSLIDFRNTHVSMSNTYFQDRLINWREI